MQLLTSWTVGKLRYNSQLSLSAKKEEHNELHIAYHEERYQISVLLKAGVNQGVANDVGFITLPDGRRFAIAVFTKSSTTPEAYRDRAIAEVSRTL